MPREFCVRDQVFCIQKYYIALFLICKAFLPMHFFRFHIEKMIQRKRACIFAFFMYTISSVRCTFLINAWVHGGYSAAYVNERLYDGYWSVLQMRDSPADIAQPYKREALRRVLHSPINDRISRRKQAAASFLCTRSVHTEFQRFRQHFLHFLFRYSESRIIGQREFRPFPRCSVKLCRQTGHSSKETE